MKISIIIPVYNKEKFINLLRNNRINYSDIQSKPFLVISSYNINFIKIGLSKKKSFNNLSEESKANFAAVASNSTIAALKEFLVGSGRFTPEEAAALDKIPTKDMIHISLDALIANPQQVMTQLQNVIAEVQGQATGMAQEGQTTDMAQADTGMMANEATTDRPPTQPV